MWIAVERICIFWLHGYSGFSLIRDRSSLRSMRGDIYFYLAQLIALIVEYKGSMVTVSQKLDGVPRKSSGSLFENGRGWDSEISLLQGLINIYNR